MLFGHEIWTVSHENSHLVQLYSCLFSTYPHTFPCGKFELRPAEPVSEVAAAAAIAAKKLESFDADASLTSLGQYRMEVEQRLRETEQKLKELEDEQKQG